MCSKAVDSLTACVNLPFQVSNSDFVFEDDEEDEPVFEFERRAEPVKRGCSVWETVMVYALGVEGAHVVGPTHKRSCACICAACMHT